MQKKGGAFLPRPLKFHTMKKEMFDKMQSLPIKYFDTHTHGEIMSHYTNDTDTLRQMISQSLPKLISSIATIIAVFFAMLTISIPLTIFIILFVLFMFKVTGKVAGNSGRYFASQQKTLSEMNGYIEEMVSGQKVVKVFTHEDEAKAKFDETVEAHFFQFGLFSVFFL